MYVDRARATIEIPTPHTLEQRLAAENNAGLAHEIFKQVELAQRELERLSIDGNLAMAWRKLNTAHVEHIADLFGHAAATQQCTATARELHQRKRLGKVVIGAAIESHDLIELGVFCREHHDRHRRRLGGSAQTAHNLDAIGVG